MPEPVPDAREGGGAAGSTDSTLGDSLIPLVNKLQDIFSQASGGCGACLWPASAAVVGVDQRRQRFEHGKAGQTGGPGPGLWPGGCWGRHAPCSTLIAVVRVRAAMGVWARWLCPSSTTTQQTFLFGSRHRRCNRFFCRCRRPALFASLDGALLRNATGDRGHEAGPAASGGRRQPEQRQEQRARSSRECRRLNACHPRSAAARWLLFCLRGDTWCDVCISSSGLCRGTRGADAQRERAPHAPRVCPPAELYTRHGTRCLYRWCLWRAACSSSCLAPSAPGAERRSGVTSCPAATRL